jgi:hypothetical protein
MNPLSLIGGLLPGGPLIYLIGGAVGVLAIIFVIYRAGRKSAKADHLQEAYDALERDISTIGRARNARRAAERGSLLQDDGFRRD